MQFFNGKTAGLAALGLGLVTSFGLAKSVDARTPAIVAQATALPEASNKEKIMDLRECRGYNRAARAFTSDYNDIGDILKNIPSSDSLYPKVVEIRTQLNDARVTAERRISTNCPNFKG